MRATQVTPAPSIEERTPSDLALLCTTQLGGPHSRAMTGLFVSPADNGFIRRILNAGNPNQTLTAVCQDRVA
jgi:hypothetical protein